MKAGSDKIQECFIVLGKTISRYRKLKKITLEGLGLEIGLDKSAIHHIENGKPITVTTLIKISAVLEVSLVDLVEDIPLLDKKMVCF